MFEQSYADGGSMAAGEETQELSWPAALGPWLVEVGASQQSESRVLGMGEELVIGSARDADLRVCDRSVSGHHCRLVATRQGVELSDLGSKNGVFVGRARTTHCVLPDSGGVVVIGAATVAVRPQTDHATVPARSVPGLVGDSQVMRRVADAVHRYAALGRPVLIQGESGTGKDVVARALHDLSGRKGAYVPMNVGAVAESLADAELFGHRRGAFTGAVESREGAFEQAHRGTLFLDEVAELSHAMQVKLLRVVEDGQVRPVGGKALCVDARVVSATWAALSDRVKQGRFRPDLYHRLSTLVIELPPLRQRRSDIPQLARYLLERHQSELGPRHLAPAALARLVAYDWPGNVRELSGVLYRAAVVSSGARIDEGHVHEALPSSGTAPHDPVVSSGRQVTVDEARVLLEQNGGNASAAARAAGVPRSTFRAWLGGRRRAG